MMRKYIHYWAFFYEPLCFFPITLVEQVELTFNAVAGGEQWTDRQGGNTDVQ